VRVRSRLKLSLSIASACLIGVIALAAPASPDVPRPVRTIDASRALDAGPLGPVDVVLTRTPPDPAPLVEREQWVFDLRWDRGDVWLVGVSPLKLSSAQATPRAMGRFALELFEGPALVERVRFDFPLLGSPDPADAGRAALPSLTQKLRTRIGVVFPATARGTRLELWDRATDRRWSLPWPPLPASQMDAGGPAGPEASSPTERAF
jgi:hypothetical protein